MLCGHLATTTVKLHDNMWPGALYKAVSPDGPSKSDTKLRENRPFGFSTA